MRPMRLRRPRRPEVDKEEDGERGGRDGGGGGGQRRKDEDAEDEGGGRSCWCRRHTGWCALLTMATMAATAPAMALAGSLLPSTFQLSTQWRRWQLSVDELARRRREANERARAAVRARAAAAAAAAAAAPNEDADLDALLLLPEDEVLFVRYYTHRLSMLCDRALKLPATIRVRAIEGRRTFKCWGRLLSLSHLLLPNGPRTGNGRDVPEALLPCTIHYRLPPQDRAVRAAERSSAKHTHSLTHRSDRHGLGIAQADGAVPGVQDRGTLLQRAAVCHARATGPRARGRPPRAGARLDRGHPV